MCINLNSIMYQYIAVTPMVDWSKTVHACYTINQAFDLGRDATVAPCDWQSNAADVSIAYRLATRQAKKWSENHFHQLKDLGYESFSTDEFTHTYTPMVNHIHFIQLFEAWCVASI